MKKVCKKCNIEKEFDEFGKHKYGKNGLRSECKPCVNAYAKEHYAKNNEEIKEKSIKYYKNNKEKYKSYYEKNIENIKESSKKYRINNKENIKEYNKEYVKCKRNTNFIYKLGLNIGRLIRQSLKNNGFKKKSRTHEIVGCLFDYLIIHLETNKYGFKYGDKNIDIDHIVSLSSVNTEDAIIKLNHFSNLQLLPSDYNRNVKKNKEFDIEDFEKWMEFQFISSPESLP